MAPESRLYTHLGQTTVTPFLVITGFLFYGKVLENKNKPIDWLRLYVSHCLRILPLYFLVMLAGAVVIALIRYSGWVQPMQSPWSEKSLTGLFTAGVTWTLGYEWKFYYALPLLALTVGCVPWTWLMFSVAILLASGAGRALNLHACAFAGFDTAYAAPPLLLLAASFALMANGAGLWGLLTADLPRVFGEMTYSIYLLHGPWLFVAFRFVLGFDWVVQLSPIQYWGMVGLLTPVLLGLSAVTYKKLELPLMRKTTAWTLRLRKVAAIARRSV